jgi:CRISPR system Cascade subunit CasB
MMTTMNPESAPTEAPAPTAPTVASLVQRLAGLLQRSPALTRGDLADLRRMDPRRPAAAFFKLEGLVLDEVLPGDAARRGDLEARWAAVVLGLAQLGDLHAPQARLGVALAEAGFSELRFARLLQADDERLLDELPALARFLAAKGVPADWSAAARLALSAGRRDEDEIRRHLARDYYGALARRQND